MTEITTLDQLDAALAATADRPAFFFKHSTACPVSSGALRRANDYFAKGGDAPACYLIKVIESRPVSNALAQKTGVAHASPQILLIDHGRSVWDTSHFDINAETIERAVLANAGK